MRRSSTIEAVESVLARLSGRLPATAGSKPVAARHRDLQNQAAALAHELVAGAGSQLPAESVELLGFLVAAITVRLAAQGARPTTRQLSPVLLEVDSAAPLDISTPRLPGCGRSFTRSLSTPSTSWATAVSTPTGA